MRKHLNILACCKLVENPSPPNLVNTNCEPDAANHKLHNFNTLAQDVSHTIISQASKSELQTFVASYTAFTWLKSCEAILDLIAGKHRQNTSEFCNHSIQSIPRAKRTCLFAFWMSETLPHHACIISLCLRFLNNFIFSCTNQLQDVIKLSWKGGCTDY